MSEKIFECLQSGCVPLYTGCDNITDYIPKECFIFVDLNTTPYELKSRLELITRGEWIDYVTAGQKFLASSAFYNVFSSNAFANTLMRHILELTSNDLMTNLDSDK